MRKLTFAVLAFAILVTPVIAAEMTLDEILVASYEARGGLDKIKAVETLKFNGTMMMGPGAETPFSITFKRPQMARMEFELQGMTSIQSYDGETAWMIMPFMGKTDPEVMADDQAKMLKERADFDGPLVDWKEKGHQLELIGLEDVEGTEAYKIKVTMANGDIRYYYLDSEYFITIKTESKTMVQGNEMEVEMTHSDYKEVDGLMFAHSYETKQKGGEHGSYLTIKEIELGLDVDNEFFAMPPAAASEESSG